MRPAGVARPGVFENCLSDAKPAVLEAEQVDAADDDVAPGQRWVRRGPLQERSDGVEMLPLD